MHQTKDSTMLIKFSRPAFFLLLLIATFQLHAQQTRLSLTFHNDFEEEVFTGFIDSVNTEVLPLLVAITPKSSETMVRNAQTQIKIFVDKLDAKKLNVSKKGKQIKYVFKEVHNHFLRKYLERALFSDIFIAGTYNCVTASALYALVFDELNIPYEVIELPTHVYLIAYPESEKIKVETTDPMSGYIVHDDRFKREYVQFMKKNKIISDYEFRHKSHDELFNEYFYNIKSVNVKALSSYQYFNEGLWLLMKENKQAALQYFKKSYQIEPHYKTKYLCVALLEEELSSSQLHSDSDIETMIDLYKILPEMYNQERLGNDIQYIAQERMIERGDFNGFDRAYKIYVNNIEDSLLLNEVDFWYHFKRGEGFHMKGKVDKAFQEYCKAYAIRDGNIRLQNNLNSLVPARVLNDVGYAESSIKLRLSELDYLTSNYSFLLKNDDFVANYLLLKCNLGNSYVSSMQITNTIELLNSIEKGYKLENFETAKIAYSKLYGSLGFYYEFKNRNKTKAIKYYSRAFELDPSNRQLLKAFDRINFGS